ncbi:unnamed protein product [Protopolystoma xenopodis]|uniref:Uncharacterized protein n=1 Tax=Protopolystoma xenopodis TaxID=117903 RepID=A0A448X7X5_9PLAT|nr:unnamed protein product [Protopolystoma xenopodis]
MERPSSSGGTDLPISPRNTSTRNGTNFPTSLFRSARAMAAPEDTTFALSLSLFLSFSISTITSIRYDRDYAQRVFCMQRFFRWLIGGRTDP